MESQRSKKSRSLGIDPVPPRQLTSLKRPDLGDRNHSAPSVPLQKQSAPNRSSHSSKPSAGTKHNSRAGSRDDPALRSSGHAGDSLSSDRHGRSSQPSKVPISSDNLQLISLVVLGNDGVGKTGFIRNALDLRRPSTTPLSSSKVSLGGALYRVQLLELSVDDVDLINGTKIAWPKDINGATTPFVDGAFVLYDVTDVESLTGVPQILAALNESEIPCSLISSKVDCPSDEQEVDPGFTRQVRQRFAGVAVGEATIESSDSAKRCLLQALKVILGTAIPQEDKPYKASQPNSRPRSRAPSTGQTQDSSRTSSTSRSRSQSRTHAFRVKSKEQLVAAFKQASHVQADNSKPFEEITPKSPPKTPLRVDTGSFGRIPARQTGPQTPVSFSEAQNSRITSASERAISTVPQTPESYKERDLQRRGSASTTESQTYRTYQTFLNMDDESLCEDKTEKESPAAPEEKIQEPISQDSTRSEGGVPFSELVDRLLSMPTSKGGSKFVPSFLCLYRAFATPTMLLTAIVDAFVKTEKSDLIQFTKAAEQLRYLSVIAQWTANYPGDFANSAVRELAVTFIKDLEKSKNFGPAAKEISNNLQLIVVDEDDDWAYLDGPQLPRSRGNTLSHKASSSDAFSRPTTKSGKDGESYDSDSEFGVNKELSSPMRSAPTSSASSLLKSANPSSQSAINLVALESAREQAKCLKFVPHLRLSKLQWHQFMETPIEELAREITRVDWTMYSAIRPRDFVRQATTSSPQRLRSGQIDPISMMSKQFNHLTFFVSAMVLLRDKPKHRAKMLEKFMQLAWKIRQQNNYQSLGAIVAALKGEEIVRLGQTHELIHPDIHKNFWKLKILMDHSKSHSAYRMAWENSPRERIPFLPRVQEDLTKAAIGNPTFIGSNIKWTKFEVMGETIVSIQRSQEQAYTFPERTAKSQELARLILDTKVLEGPEDSDDPRCELFERSKQVEPLTAVSDGKKKFDWLRR